MCGIVGYVGKKSAKDFLVEGLKRLEYRGYDSAGIAVMQEVKGTQKIQTVRAVGKVINLENKLSEHMS
ncbi:MAG: glutamine--fructose-6-phosphate transaminase (isomerizing), partial [Candidatus Moranbacteria bacterium CG_4_10_14_3_um_filter_45_9]